MPIRSSTEVIVFPDKNSLSRDAAFRFVGLSHREPNAPFRVVLAGGSTPALLYRLLGTPEFIRSVNWDRVHLYFGDERAVSPSNQESNFFMAYENLVSRVPIPASQVYRLPAEEIDLQSASRAYERQIRAHFEGFPSPAFDLVLLGMGSDGHCASLFPGKASLMEQDRWVIPAEPGLNPFVPRMTFSYPLLNLAKQVLFLVAGEDKAEALAHVLEGEYQPERYPAQGISPTQGTVTWLVDIAAASQLRF